jgi:DNA repair ATPase RecN
MSEDRTQNLPGGDLGEVLSILRSMDARLTTLEDKVDRRLQETRPIWEQVLVRLTNVEERLTNVEQELVGVKQGLDKVEARLGKVEDEVDNLVRKFRLFNEDILKYRTSRTI